MNAEQKTILKKYFSGECSKEERLIIERLYLTDDNPAFAGYLRTEWENLPQHPIIDEAVAMKRYANISKLIGKRKRKSNNAYFWMRAAAILLLVLAPVCYLILNSNKTLTAPVQSWVTITTGIGQQKSLVLTDGSRVWLNCASSVSFPKDFGNNKRLVKIKGEALFKVVKDKNKPFIVEFKNHYTQVLGTSFNVEAYTEQISDRITVIEGRVAVGKVNKGKLRQYTVLNANESAVLPVNSDLFEKTAVNSSKEAIAWKNGEILFRMAKLPEVIAELRRWYNVDLVLQAPPGADMPSFTILLKSKTPLDDVLKMLSMTNRLSYKKIDNKIIVTPD